jgi:hypothetical protein
MYGAANTPGALNVWNAYNAVTVATSTNQSSMTWSYPTPNTTVRAANNSANMRIAFVSGLSNDGIAASYNAGVAISAGAANFAQMGLALDSTTTYDSFQDPQGVAGQIFGAFTSSTKFYIPQTGYHFISANESGDGTSNPTFLGAGKSVLNVQLRM